MRNALPDPFHLPSCTLAAAALVCAAVLGGCAGSSDRAAMSGGVRRAECLERLDEQWSAAAGRRDVAEVAALYAENAVLNPPDMPAVHGRAEAKNLWEQMLADPANSISWRATRSGMAGSGNLGYTSGTYVMNSRGPDGRPATEHGKFLCVWQRMPDGSWQAVQDMWNADSK